LTVSAEQAGDAFVCPHCARKLAFTPPAERAAPVAVPARAESGSARWFLARNKQRLGPYTSAQLKQFADAGQIQPEDMIHREGRQKWVSAGSIKGLFTAARPEPPPAAVAVPEPQVILEPFVNFAAAPVARSTRPPGPGRGKLWMGVAGAACVAIVAVVLFFLLRKGDGDQAGGPSRKLDLSYVAADFNAAVIVHPRRILERREFAKLLEDESFTNFVKEAGADPRKIEQVVILIEPTLKSEVPVMPAFIVRFAESVDGAALVMKALQNAEKASFEGKEYYRGKKGMLANEKGCAYVADERTLLTAPETTLKKMLTAKDARSPLRDRLPKLDLAHDVIGIFVMEQTERKDGGPTVRKALGEILAQAKGNPAFEGADKLAEQIAAVTLSLDMDGDTLLSLDVEATDETAATSMHGLANNGLNLVKAFVPVAKKGLTGNLPPDAVEPVSKLVDQLVAGTSLAKDGSHVVLTIKMPQELPGLIEKFGPMLKEIGPQAPAPPVKRKEGLPTKGKSTGKRSK
jgi:hypothetical protein